MSEAAPRATPLRAVHESLGATMTAFAGWLMPLRYAGEISEHRCVRNAAGLFDLSHMGEIAVTGPQAAAALDYALVGQLVRAGARPRRYTMICAPDGGVLDDLIVYRLADDELPGRRERRQHRHGAARRSATARPGTTPRSRDQTAEYALIAIQGPLRPRSWPAHRRRPRRREVLHRLPGDRGRAAGPAGPDRLHGRGRVRAVHRPGRRALCDVPGRGRGGGPGAPPGWPPATRSGWKPGCRCTATSWAGDDAVRRRPGPGGQVGQAW